MRLLSRLSVRLIALLITTLAAGHTLAANPAALPALGADPKQSTVSGLSSGAFMAVQFSVAYSASIAGAGIVAGGPYFCAGLGSSSGADRFLTTAMTECMRPAGAAPSGNRAWKEAQLFAARGLIDPVKNLRRQRIYLFTGASDSIVLPAVVKQTLAFYRAAGVPDSQIKYVDNINAGHALITDNRADLSCAANAPPNLNNCGFVQAKEILNQLYGNLNPASAKATGELLDFDQKPFRGNGYTGLSDVGHVYIPEVCRKESCRVHIVFHGCTQEDSRIGNRFYTTTGYNELADTNRIVVLYPQIRTNEARNPKGCWDFWGYTNNAPARPDFIAKDARQMAAIDAMLRRLTRHAPK